MNPLLPIVRADDTEVTSLTPSGLALIMCYLNPRWTPREMRQYRKIDRGVSDRLYQGVSELYKERQFNYPDYIYKRQADGKVNTIKAGLMDGRLTELGKFKAIVLLGRRLESSIPFVPERTKQIYSWWSFGYKSSAEFSPGPAQTPRKFHRRPERPGAANVFRIKAGLKPKPERLPDGRVEFEDYASKFDAALEDRALTPQEYAINQIVAVDPVLMAKAETVVREWTNQFYTASRVSAYARKSLAAIVAGIVSRVMEDGEWKTWTR